MPPTDCAEKATPCFFAAAASPSHSCRVRAGQRLVKARRLHQLQGRQTGGDGHRIARQRSGLIDRAERGDLFHDLALAAKSAERHAAADHLAERGQIRRDAVVGPVRFSDRRGSRSSLRRKSARRHAAVHSSRMASRNACCGTIRFMLPTTGSTMTAAMLAPCSAKAFSSCGDIVVIEHQRVLCQIGRNAGRTRIAEGQHARAGLHQQAVAVPVITALELDQQVTRRCSRAPDGWRSSSPRCPS